MQTRRVKKSAIVIDDWKLLFFKERLDASGFDYAKKENTPANGAITLFVETNEMWRLSKVVEASNEAAAMHKRRQKWAVAKARKKKGKER